MALTKRESAQIRVVINRANVGPGWYSESPASGPVNAMHAELKAQTRWFMNDLIKELQGVLAPNERVKLPRA